MPRDERRMEAFREALDDCQLVDLEYSRSWITWERHNFWETNIRERLDRGVTCDTWVDLFPNTSIQHLPHSFSDHCLFLYVQINMLIHQ